MSNLAYFKRKEHGSRRVFKELKNILFRRLTTKSSNLFLRGGDVISVGPQANSLHEPDLTGAIDYCCDSGYSDFLIDIGSNIGLTTAQNGAGFSRIICFEPNPLCVHILKVNVEIAGLAGKAEVCEYGLGEAEGNYELWIPRHNWGGAFVKSDENSYSEDLILSKDGLSEFKDSQYMIKNIEVRSAKRILSEKFSSLIDAGLTKGVIKIDVEGMEGVVIKGIADSIPDTVKAIIFFENWDDNINYKDIMAMFAKRRVKIMKLNYERPFRKNWPRLVKAALLLLRSTELRIDNIEDSKDRTGDLAIVLE